MRMQGIVLLGAFLKLTPYAARERDDRRAGLRGRREGPAQVLRQARRPRRAGQPDLRQARLQRDPAKFLPSSSIPEPAAAGSAPACPAVRLSIDAHPFCRVQRLMHTQEIVDADDHSSSRPSMNEAHDQDPFNNNSYGTLVDARLQARQPAGPRRPRLQRADHPRLRGRLRPRRTCPPTCRWPARSSPPAPPRCATSATSPRRSPSTSPRTAPAAWTA